MAGRQYRFAMKPGAVYEMVLKDFEQFPTMWAAYVDRHSREESPIRTIGEPLSRRALPEASAAFEKMETVFQESPTGQIARAMIEFAKRMAT